MLAHLYTNVLFFCLSCSLYAQIVPTYDDIWIPMRDSMQLQADIYIPAGVDSAEVILIQTPYNKDLFWALPLGVGLNVDGQPFIWVVADWRGFYGSSGASGGTSTNGEDAFDICEWISQQTWHKDRIGTWGPSALGGIQYQLIREQHPNHTCAVPIVAHAHQSYDSYFYGGTLEKARLEQMDALGYGISPVVLANPYYNAIWIFAENTTWYPPDITIPTLQIGGWYDHNIDKMIDFYEDSRNLAASTVQDEQWLLVGPWVHGGIGIANIGSSIQGELSYPNAEYVSDTMAWNFFLHYLLDAPNNWQNTDKITYYEMGLDQWSTSNNTNIAASSTDILYLDDLSLIPQNGTGSSSFISDPSNPSPTIGGATLHATLDQGPYDQSGLEGRSDIVTFSTQVLSGDVSISGRVRLNLYLETDQPDCDIVARLVDVYDNGDNMLITDGIKRLRFRNGYQQVDESFMSAGSIYNVAIDLPFTNYTWLSGHQIKVYLSGNSSYRWDVNLQNGATMYVAGDTNVANITIHHDAANPSRIILPGSNPILSNVILTNSPISIYPNPAKDQLFIEAESNIDAVIINDMMGRSLFSSSFHPKEINIADYLPGVYLVSLKTNDRWIKKRFIKH